MEQIKLRRQLAVVLQIKDGAIGARPVMTKVRIEKFQVNKTNGQDYTRCMHVLTHTPYSHLKNILSHILHVRILKQQKSIQGPRGKYHKIPGSKIHDYLTSKPTIKLL